MGYILIALFGTEQERGVFRSQVNAQHRRANEGRDGVIDFNTFDAELQLWVAACMHRGIIDAVTFLHGPPNEADQGDLLIMSSRFATTLQVPNDKWPQTIGEFDVYWHESLALVVFNDDTRAYLLGIASLRFLPFPLDRIFGPSHRFLTAGFLPPLIRDQLGLAWSPRRQRRFERVTKGLRVLNHLLPRPLREFPWNVIERDTRRRIRRHHSIV